ncbi:hypothetical protein FDW83_07480 [Pseudarthrobacter sp. NamE2]|uniref:O-antigen ligase family protein n=1 Tax=Pseudarthrobacter sp. NamE2 TaxID=2576838 RepID=UPI0010FE1F06|nr:O-antigen ligase family protein [Pseudarthrobacter sp. NamE2]TLM84547.1 hypothetical protein FDW83_07480 [Pseudarthrobacter sp. NamE2]
MTSIWMVFLATAAITAFVLFTAVLKRWPSVGAFSVTLNLVVAWEIPNPPALANIGGTSVYYLDVLSVAALAIALLQSSSLAQNLRSAFWPWIGLGFLLLVSLTTGLLENDFGKTVNEFRSFFHPYATTTWAMSLAWNRAAAESLIRKLTMTLGWFLTVVAGYHLARYGLGSASGFVDAASGIEQTTRPLVSSQALIVLLCSVLCFWYWRQSRRRIWFISALIFLLVVVVSQQRTVWAVGLASVAVIFLFARAGTKGIIALFVFLSAWAVGILLTGQFIPQVLAELSNSATDSGTYDARVRSWTNLINQSISSGLSNILFGQAMGVGFGRFEGAGRWVEFAPHNWYVTLYLRIGIIGLSMMAVFLLVVLARLLRYRENMAALAVVSAVIVYGWSYSWPWYISLFFAWAVSAIRTPQLDEVPMIMPKRHLEFGMSFTKEKRPNH